MKELYERIKDPAYQKDLAKLETIVKRFRVLGGELKVHHMYKVQNRYVTYADPSQDVDGIVRLTNRLYTLYREKKLDFEWEVRHPSMWGVVMFND